MKFHLVLLNYRFSVIKNKGMKTTFLLPLLLIFGAVPLSSQTLDFLGNETAFFPPSTTVAVPNAGQTNEGGSDGLLEVGDTWRFQNVRVGVDAFLTITGLSGDATLMGVNSGNASFSPIYNASGEVLENVVGETTTPLPSYDSALSIGFFAENFTSAIFDFSLSFAESSTGDLVPITQIFTVYDLDTSSNGVRETFGIGGADYQNLWTGSAIADNGIVGGYRSLSGPTSAGFVDLDSENLIEQDPVSVVFDVVNQDTLNFRWELERATVGNNSRKFFLAGAKVVSIPEPSTMLLSILGFAAVLRRKR